LKALLVATAVLSLAGDAVALWLALHSRRLERLNAARLERVLAHIDALDATVEDQLYHAKTKENTP
jgi:hypothetical protein